jgi:SAM-dependent methyltransferase
MTPRAPRVELYDSIGQGYRRLRRADARIGELIRDALGEARSVVNVGAGTGSYEPSDRRVVAVEPSWTMIRQRAATAARAVRGSAMALPFADRAFDASLAVLTLHHWPSWRGGVRELARVAAERVVLLTCDLSALSFWLTDDYFPQIPAMDRRLFPTLAELEGELGRISVVQVPVSHDCSDGFLGAYWRRPRAYLDADVRRAISAFARIGGVEAGIARLRRDLDSGAWQRRYGALLARESLDLGYRLVVSRRSR